MAERFPMTATVRPSEKKSARAARQSGQVPGVVYGNGVDPIVISVGASDILKTYRKSGGSSIIDLDIDGTVVPCLIHDLNLHPVRDEIWHVDFLAVNMKENIVAHVPLKFVGESHAVKMLGGIFMAEHNEIVIRCLPADIPHDIEIDISALDSLHAHVTVADLKLDPEKYEVMGFEEGVVLCSVASKGGASMEDSLPTVETEGEEGEAEASAE